MLIREIYIEGDFVSIEGLNQLNRNIKNEKKSLYTFHSAKKIYFAQTSSKYLLIEKKNNSEIKTVSLSKRNTIIKSKENGILIFPKSR